MNPPLSLHFLPHSLITSLPSPPPMPSSMALLLLLLLHNALPISALSSSLLGVNYGRVADNLPRPSSALPLLSSLSISRVRLYDADPPTVSAISAAGLELVVALPDSLIPSLSSPAAASTWVSSNLLPHLPAAKFAALTVGNEILTSNNSALVAALLPAMKSLQTAISSFDGLKSTAVTTAHSLAVLAASYPPSSARFRPDLLPYICPLIDFLTENRSPFFVNAYPYFAYKDDPAHVPLDYALSEPDSGVVDPGSGLKYSSMLAAQVDAVYAAIAAAAGEKGKMLEVRVSETGWPSAGDANEPGATPENAGKYNGNLMRMVAARKGTPAIPGKPLRVYVFALFNEDLKPGPKSERNYGLFKPDGMPAYDLVGYTPAKENTTGSGGGAGGGGGGGAAKQRGDDWTPASFSGYYGISAAGEPWKWMGGAMAVESWIWVFTVALILIGF